MNSGHTHAALITRSNIGQVLSLIGHPNDALQFLRGASGSAHKSGSAAQVTALNVSWSLFLICVGRSGAAFRSTANTCRVAEGAELWQWMLEIKRCMALALWNLGKPDEANGLLVESIARYEERAPFDVRLSARLTLAQIEQARGAGIEAVEAAVKPLLETARKKKMRWHLTTALLVRGEALLGANRAEEAEAGLQEAVDIAMKNADRTIFWQGAHLLGRAYEQMLRYERALACYRMASLTIQELAMNIDEERYRESFLAQPRVRGALERYDRLRGEVGKQAKHDLAVSNRSEMISRRMLGALSAIGQRLTSTLDLDQLMAGILDLAIENVRAERGIIFLRDDLSEEMRPECARGMDRESLSEVSTFSRTVIQQVARGQTLLTVDVGKDPALSTSKSVVLHQIKSILCVPMRARGKVAGVIYLDTRRGPQLFTEKERAFVESFASQAAIAIENAKLFGLMNAENAHLQREARSRGRFENLLGTSPAMARLRELIGGVLDSDCNVLIAGESGTGKELVARALHYSGPRQKKKFVAIDCGALPEHLLEAELFGYARGAFTDAARDRLGLIEEAHGGTLFLDEITNTTPAMQAKLLRVLQEHEVRRLGENTPRRVELRVVAATNADIKALIAQGRFRQDLYYRLNVVTIEVPPLRERREDIPLLAAHFLRARARAGVPAKRLGPGVSAILSRHDWPGNVRELENVIERMVVLTPGNVILADDLPETIRPAANASGGQKTGEQAMIEEALRRCAGDKAKAARFIGWNRQKLYRRMKEYRIPSDYGKAA